MSTSADADELDVEEVDLSERKELTGSNSNQDIVEVLRIGVIVGMAISSEKKIECE